MAPKGGASSDDEKEAADEHGDPFLDFGFLSRVQEHKAAGNADFAKERYADAVKEYSAALGLLVSIAEDKSIVVGLKKWEEVIVLRSTIYLNRSACHFKLKAWHEAVDDAAACLAGNIPAETNFTHEHILADAKPSDIPEVDPRLSRATVTKAWFRMSECYLSLGYVSRAAFAAKRAASSCDDEKTGALIAYHLKKIVASARRAKQLQRKQFKDYWSKLTDQEGGYVKADFSKRGQAKSKWATLPSDDKLKHIDELDGSDGDSDSDFEGLAGATADDTGVAAALAALPALEEGAMVSAPQREDPRSRDPMDVKLEEVWRRRQQEEMDRARSYERQRKRLSAGPGKAKRAAACDSEDD